MKSERQDTGGGEIEKKTLVKSKKTKNDWCELGQKIAKDRITYVDKLTHRVG